ncbi:MAG: metallophosphoesterase [Phycisphaerae bacterium]|nr:metallophosphoesterase [Phycisphaerae bacterium]
MIELCRQGIEVNGGSAFRVGNVIHLPPAGRVIVTGDLHGHRRNFERVVAFADLGHHPETYVVFQEILHGGPEDEAGGCLSFKLFFDVLKYQLEFPGQVFLVMGNHDTAIIVDNDVMKAGKEMNVALKAAMRRSFGERYEANLAALRAYLLSQPVAVRFPNRIWMSHSLPADRFVDSFDMALFERKLLSGDMLRPEPLYKLTWGRRQSPEAIEKMARLLDVDYFVVGHQPQEQGWCVVGQRLIILASDHNHGCMITFDLSRTYELDELINQIVPLASIATES